MGTRIEAVGLAAGRWRDRSSALKLADRAGADLLGKAGRRPEDVDLLVNVGIYRDRNLGEPALAPLIQQDIGINPGDPRQGHRASFSMDIANGACGVLTALQVVDGFIGAGTISSALVVTSDADPGHHLAQGFPFSPAGGAVLCAPCPDGTGLAGFRWKNSDDGGASFRSTVAQQGGKNKLTVHRDAMFDKQVAVLASRAAHDVMEDNRIDRVDLVIGSPASAEFADVLAGELGLPVDRIIVEGPQLHTVAFVAALDTAIRTGRLGAAQTVLFVCGAAGLSAGAALYHP